MKNIQSTHVSNRPVRVAALLAGFLAGGVLVAQAQTPIPASLKAPPGSYDTGQRGFLMRTHQITTPRTPGDQNSIANVESQLRGDFGPGIATNGPLGGYFKVDILDHDVSRINPDSGGAGYNNLPFPGIDLDELTPSPTYNPTNIAVEVIGFLNLPAGNTTLTLRSDDSVRLTIGIGSNPYDFMALQPEGALFDGGRSPGNSTFTLSVSSAGVYPIRIVYGQGGGGGTLEFSATFDSFGFPMTALVNDPVYEGSVPACYLPATIPIVPTAAYVSFLEPLPGATGVSPLPMLLAELQDSGTTVDTNGLSLAVDGNPASVLVSKTGGRTIVTGTVTNLLTPNSVHAATLVYQDNTPKTFTNTWNFTVMNYFPLPARYAYPAGSGDAAAKGFSGKIHVARANVGFTAVIASTDARLDDSYNAYSNLAQTVSFPGPTANTVNNDFTYTRNEPINYSMDGTASAVLDNGQFNSINGFPDMIYPGLPGATDETRAAWTSAPNMAWASWAWVELPQGLVQINIGHFDAGQVAIHANDPRDIFRESVVIFDSNGGNRTDSTLVFVEQAGLYGFRCAQAAFGTAASLWFEFYVSDPLDANNRTLIGVPTNTTYQAYTQLTVPTRPYIDAVRPDVASSGASPSTSVEVDVINLGAETPVLKVNGQTVSYTTSVVGNKTTLGYTPPQPFAKAAAVTVSLTYGTTTSTWNFFTTSGLKALIVGNENVAIRERLGSVFKLDVTQTPELQVPLDTNYLSQFALIWNSEAVNSGNAGPYILLVRELPIPAINVESANANTGNKHWYLGSAANNFGGNNVHFVVVTNADFGLPLGTNRITKIGAANGTWHAADLGQTGGYTSVGYGPGNEAAAAVAMFEKGTVQPFNGPDGLTPFVMPARRVQMAMAGPGMISVWNDDAWKIFDKVVEWLLPPQPPKLSIAASGGNVTLSWTSTGVLEESTTMTPGSWSNSANQANPQTRAATGTKFFRVRQ